MSSFGASYAQNTKMTMNLKDVAVKEVLQQIESSTEFSFMYDNKKIDVNRKVDVLAEEKTIDVILAQLFTSNNVIYEVIDKHIVLMPSDSPSFAGQQVKKLTGKVSDTSGAALPGVSIVLKGTTTGTISDGDGNFSLSGIPENATLQFSFIGMKRQEINIGIKNHLDGCDGGGDYWCSRCGGYRFGHQT
jgi:type II secretory pathway component GspD/PulD (secretin)